MQVTPGISYANVIRLAVACGDCNDDGLLPVSRTQFADVASHRETVQYGHQDVEQHNIGSLCGNAHQRIPAVQCNPNRVTLHA
jgi:hypothetical protein